jgi:hypothetical protein
LSWDTSKMETTILTTAATLYPAFPGRSLEVSKPNSLRLGKSVH